MAASRLIRGEQNTPGAWRIRVNGQLRSLFAEEAPPGYVPIVDAIRTLGSSRQTVLQRVKRRELQASISADDVEARS
jgi:hypothetical protein